MIRFRQKVSPERVLYNNIVAVNAKSHSSKVIQELNDLILKFLWAQLEAREMVIIVCELHYDTIEDYAATFEDEHFKFLSLDNECSPSEIFYELLHAYPSIKHAKNFFIKTVYKEDLSIILEFNFS